MWCTSPGRGGWRCRAPSSTRQQSTMQELVDLSLIGRQLNLAVVGHAFRPVHAIRRSLNARSCAALEPSRQTWIFEAMKRLRTRHASADDLASVGSSVLRSGLATNLLWIGALKFKQYEVENIDPLLRSSPLFSRLREKLGARRLARVIGIAEIAVGSLIAAKPAAPKASAAASFGAVGMFLTTLSFLVTTPEARQEGEGMLVPSPAGQFLLKDTVLLAAALLTAAESLQAARG
jgi:reactive chlorine resistance protein C